MWRVPRASALTNLGLAALASFILVLFTVSNLLAALYVLLCVLMVDVDILGLMWLWGLDIDSVTIINLVLAIGLVIDYSAHIAHAFVVAKGTKQQRADLAIGNIGTAVFHGAMSTFVCILVLSGSTSCKPLPRRVASPPGPTSPACVSSARLHAHALSLSAP